MLGCLVSLTIITTSSDNQAYLMRRRNGRLAACAPCHARKVACDHTRPVCKRCEKRNHPDECRYPASTSASAPSWPASPSEPSSASPLPSRRPAFFGYTSHNAVFEETETALALLGNEPSSSGHRAPDAAPQRTLFKYLPAPLKEAAMIVLRYLPGHVNEQFTFRGSSDRPKAWADIAAEQILGALQHVRDPEALAETLCHNSSKAISDKSDPKEWMRQFTGENIRWESVGLVWTYTVGASDTLNDLQPRQIEWKGEQNLRTAVTCLTYCIDLARHFTDANDILLDLCSKRTVLSTFTEGDASLVLRASHAISISMMTYMGLHALEDVEYTPSLCSEIKRRVVYRIFGNDTMGVAFTGRPPGLSRRFLSTPPPLDIPDDILAGDTEELARYVATLDEFGWNTQGALYPATIQRALLAVALVRDEITEMALSKRMVVTLDGLESIKTRALAAAENFPPSVMYDPDARDGDEVRQYTALVLRLGYLQNIFFVERLLLRHGKPDAGDLLMVSFDIVCLTVRLWTQKDRFSRKEIHRNFNWLLMAYGASSGGILCQELLYPTFVGAHHPRHPKLSRSSLVQQLSLLVGFLDWVRPETSNEELYSDAKRIIERVLDHHLNGQPAMDLGFMAQPDFNFDLLDTFDWMREQ